MWKFDTDFVVSNGFRFCPPLVPPAGGEADITNEYLWSMLPVESTNQVRRRDRAADRRLAGERIGECVHQGPQPALRRGFVRYNGLFVKFTIGNQPGQRLQEVTVKGQPLVETLKYTVLWLRT